MRLLRRCTDRDIIGALSPDDWLDALQVRERLLEKQKEQGVPSVEELDGALWRLAAQEPPPVLVRANSDPEGMERNGKSCPGWYRAYKLNPRQKRKRIGRRRPAHAY